MKPLPDEADILSHQIGLEARALEDLFIKSSQEYYNTPSLLGKPWYALGLESNHEDNQRDQASKQNVVMRILEAIKNFINKVLTAISSFFSKIDFTAEQARARRAREIMRKRLHVKFADDVVAKLSEKVIATLYAADLNTDFTAVFNKNLEIERKIDIPRDWQDSSDVEKIKKSSKELEEGINDLQDMISKIESSESQKASERIRNNLTNGISINGSENGDYLKSFASAEGVKKKYAEMLGAVQRSQRNGADHETVSVMQKVAAILSKQFSMETRVFKAYTQLNATIIEVNKTIFAKDNRE